LYPVQHRDQAGFQPMFGKSVLLPITDEAAVATVIADF
jgi:hypothetical protein